MSSITRETTANRQRSDGTAYGQLAERLRDQIRTGEFPPGIALPTEAELGQRYGISRQTVRRAFQDLVAEGLVYRVPGRGTFAQSGPSKYVRSSGSIEELMSLSLDTELEVLAPPAIKVDIEAAGRLHLDSDRVVTMRFRRLHDGLPYCVTTIFLPALTGAGLLDVPELAQVGTRSPITVLSVVQELAGRPFDGADQTITAVTAPLSLCSDLDCKEGQPLLRIDRVYFDDDGQLLELAVNHFQPDRYTYRFRMKAT